MPISSTSSANYIPPSSNPTTTQIISSNTTKDKFTNNIKMVYGFLEDSSNFKKNDKSAFSLDYLNTISGISAERILNLPGTTIHDILSKNFKTNDFLLRKFSNESAIKETSIKKLAEQWIEFLSKHGNDLSLSSSLNKRDQKSETAFLILF